MKACAKCPDFKLPSCSLSAPHLVYLWSIFAFVSEESIGLLFMSWNEKIWWEKKFPHRKLSEPEIYILVFLLTNCRASENWSQPKWGPWQLVWSVRPVAREWGKGGGCRLEGRNGFWKFMYASGKEDGSTWLEANSPLIPMLGESQRGQSAEGSRIGFVSSFTYLRMCRREEKMSNLEKCKQVITVHGKQVSLTLHKKHLKVLTSWHVR